MKKKIKFNYIGFVAIVLLAVSCTKEPFLEDQLVLKTAAAKGSIVRATTAPKKLLIIGIDGCKPDALLAANTPNVQGLLSNAVYSMDALTESPTWSGNGWSTMLTGVTHLKHGVTDNSFSVPNFAAYPNVLKRLETYNPALNTMSIVHWEPINRYILDGIDVKKTCTTDLAVKTEAVNALTQMDPDALFVHFDAVDHAGHAYGFSKNVAPYTKAIEATDVYIGAVLTALKNRPNYTNEDWLVILATDHGGRIAGSAGAHGGSSYEERNIFTIYNNKNFVETKIEKATAPTESITGSFVNFNSKTVYGSTNNPLYNFGNSSFTIECRVKTSGYSSDPALVSNKNWASGKNKGFVISANTGGSWKINLGDSKNRIDIAGGIINDSQWHHLTLVVNREAKLAQAYQDGTLVGQVAISALFGSLTSGLPLAIGQDGTLNYPAYLNGAIAEIRVWNKALSPASVTNHACSSVTSSHPDFSSLISYWKGTEGSGGVFADSSTNNVSVLFASNPAWVSSTAPLVCSTSVVNLVPKMVDITYSSLMWFGVPIETNWLLDGRSWLPDTN